MTYGRSQSPRFLEGMAVEERTYSEETARTTRRLLEIERLDRAEIGRPVETPAPVPAV